MSLGRLVEVEDAVLAHFARQLSDDERKLLTAARQLRNKVLHCDFSEARGRLVDLGHQPTGIELRLVKLTPGSEITDLIRAMNEDGGTRFAVESAPARGHLAHWHTQMAIDGSLEMAANVFRAAGAVVVRLAELPAKAGR